MDAQVFEGLYNLNVNEKVEKKNGLSYLSWPFAWAEVKRRYPNASYKVWKNEQGLPYSYDPLTGYMVYTEVSIGGVSHEMWLPVMDGANKAMKAEPYTYKVKDYKTKQYVDKTVAPATMFDINKTIMRCLVKNLAMFGLGLYIYAGEDLPEQEQEDKTQPAEVQQEIQQNQLEHEAELRAKVLAYVNRHNMSKDNIEKICKAYKVESLNQLTMAQCQHYINALQKKGGNINE